MVPNCAMHLIYLWSIFDWIPWFFLDFFFFFFLRAWNKCTWKRTLSDCYQLQMKSTTVLIEIRHKIWGTFLYVSKAFDKVWHTGLKSTLKSYDVDGSLLKLKENYLTGLQQRVVLNDQIPWWKNILAKVSQDSVLRSLLFLMCNNDLPNGIELIVK